MEDQVRIEFERHIDSIIKDSENQLQIIENILYSFGIEPDLKSILSFISGGCYAQSIWHHRTLNIEMTPEIKNDFIEIMKRRAWELRQAFIRALNK